MRNITNLGAVLTALARAEADEHFMHADVDVYGAPSECHCDVSRGEVERKRMARRLAVSIAGRRMGEIKRQAKARGMPIGSPAWDRFVGRVYDATYPY